MQALLDYFSHVLRLKKFHKIKHINDIKISENPFAYALPM